MTTANIAYGTRVAFANVANLVSLANNNAKPIGERSNDTALADDYAVDYQFTLATSGVSATGVINLYLLESPTPQASSPRYTDVIDPTGSSDATASIKNAPILISLNANANSQVVQGSFRLSDFGISIPPHYFSILPQNLSGAALAATGNDVEVTPITFTSA